MSAPDLSPLLLDLARQAAVIALAEADTDDCVLDVDGAAELLHLGRDTVERELRAGALPGRKVGREWRISRRALLDHISQPASAERG